ncbi:eukaryotic translation initiation factor 3 subunit E-like [Phragmites australis]|uniref:eukaryotic translation initiation factor 3 subunit E-like n=1 Tax=Phragmites australis TaxID=29695 RepID=UPI002D7699DC|nr:eukaryotic translation initiation factor 3 subunit E-like [Phragmites australis]
MAEHDLTSRLAAQLDRHLVFPLLEFLQERQLYPEEEILEAKLRLLGATNMVEYAMDIHMSLHGTDDVPDDMVARRAEVLARLKALEAAAAPLVAFLRDPQLVQELRPDRQYNVHMLRERFRIGPDQIEAMYDLAKFLFECGNYPTAVDYLYQYRVLCTNSERSVSASWGLLASEILMQNWDAALEELNRLKEIIDSKDFSSPLNQLQNRIWLMHWSLFIFFNHENGRNGIIDLFFQDRYLNAIQANARHLLRYVATAVVVNKRRRNMLKEFIKVIQQEQHCIKDPITEFLECLYVNYDFDGAQLKLMECEKVILNDPFLGKGIEQGSFTIVPLIDEFLENARLFIFERYCCIHRCINISILAEKLNMRHDEAELWIMNLVRSSKLDAKIDSVSGTLIMTTNHVNVHEQIIESLKNLDMRTYMLAKSIVEPAQAAQQAARGD